MAISMERAWNSECNIVTKLFLFFLFQQIDSEKGGVYHSENWLSASGYFVGLCNHVSIIFNYIYIYMLLCIIVMVG